MVFKVVFWFFIFLVFFTYFGYYVVLSLIAGLRKLVRKSDNSYTPTVTMIIAAFNEEKVIADKIDNCLTLDYPKDKIKFFIGSDGSEDSTNTILNNLKNDQIIPFLFDQRRGKASVLNDLASRTESEILLFSDANTMYEVKSVRNLVRYFVDPKIGGVCGRLELTAPNENIGGKGETLYWAYENKLKYLEGKIKTVFGANGAIYAIRSSLYKDLPQSKVIMDDFLIPLNIVDRGFDVIYEKEAVGQEVASTSLKDEFLRKVRIGAANFNALEEIWKLLLPNRGFIAFGLWSHKIIRWFVPFLMIAILLTNIALVGERLYNYIFYSQIAFYLFCLFGYIISVVSDKRIRFLSYGYYFISMNLALLQGFFKFLFNTQKPTWVKAKR